MLFWDVDDMEDAEETLYALINETRMLDRLGLFCDVEDMEDAEDRLLFSLRLGCWIGWDSSVMQRTWRMQRTGCSSPSD